MPSFVKKSSKKQSPSTTEGIWDNFKDSDIEGSDDDDDFENNSEKSQTKRIRAGNAFLSVEDEPFVEGESDEEDDNQWNFTEKKDVKWRHGSIQEKDFGYKRIYDDDTAEQYFSPLTYFMKYVPEVLLDEMVTFTNTYAEQNKTKKWRPTNNLEIKQFIGLQIMMGNLKLPRIEMYYGDELQYSDMKKKGRGSSEEVVSADGSVTCVKWFDNKCVSLASNYVGVGQVDTAHRYDKTTQQKVNINRPQIVRDYNINMGGVDLMNQMNESRRSNQLSYYKRRAKSLQEKVKTNKLTDATVLSYLKTKFNDQLLEFVKMQLKNCGRSKHGRRYSPKQKSLCLAMYKKGPKSYRFNETWCCLPTRRTLGRYSAQLIFQSGVDYKVLAAMKSIVLDWPHKDKFCTFGWDEVSLNAHLDYCQSLDKIEGFVEMGRANKPIFATHSLTFMVRGIEVPYKQSIGYFYTNGLKSFELAELIKLMIGRVQIIGLMPILSVCDTCSTNATAVNVLVYPNTHQTKQSGDLLQYKINGQLITHTYDPSHLIKVVRNNLQTKNLAHFVTDRWTPGLKEFEEKLQIAAWNDIDKLYRKDVLSPQRLAEALSEEHLNPNKLKMKVSIATQVFSNTCGLAMMQYVERGILQKDVVSTANFIFFMNDLFDSINGSNNHPGNSLKSAVTPNSLHFEFWEYALIMLENMFYVDKIDGERNDRSSVLKKFESTIRGYQEVAKTCFKANIPKLNIRDTTQDGLENFFGCIKSCNYSNTTTASQYRTGYTTMVINNITGTNSLYSNCQPDDSESILTNIHEFISVCQEQPHDPVYVSYPEPKPLGCADENFIVESESETDEFESMISFDLEVEDDNTSSIIQYIQSEADDSINQHHQFLETNSNMSQLKVISKISF
ncbi:uncharacterized protein LOC119075089 [Bradysia coprophila]|uniref:uncharacterized protein LOC119075089 n=1 Tax=Bradysia coprophila TaxID=38358 RepID=UPI00187DA78C|nr:uncharacterized protein LOC119075089 [Bradysia coprophila]